MKKKNEKGNSGANPQQNHEYKKEGKGEVSYKLVFTSTYVIFLLITIFAIYPGIRNYMSSSRYHQTIGDRFYYGKDNYSPNIDLAIQAYTEGARSEDAYSCRMLGIIYRDDKKQLFESVVWFNRGIEYKDTRSAVLLAHLYENESQLDMAQTERTYSIYAAYYMAQCLGDSSAKPKADKLQPHVNEEVRQSVAERCSQLRP